mmetsp:Transcript_6531/g.5858  ORF Transcript_6531/g.5858 Transcript_6531/m.5858 type:complete len:210 (+) Transcript_6531:49-678(+)
MACCLLCFDDAPLEDDPKGNRPYKFQISMMDSLTKGQPVCCLTYFCPCCVNMWIRYKVLDKDMRKYTCCQGYLNNPCFTAGNCGEETCPWLCLGLESCLCLGPSMSSSRIYVMDQYDLRPDGCDNRIVRFTNCLMCFSVILDILAIFIPCLDDAAHIVDFISNVVYHTTIGCMAGQVNYEIDFRKEFEVVVSNEFSPIAVPIKEEPYQS